MFINPTSLISKALSGLTRSESESEDDKKEETNTSAADDFSELLKGIIGKDLQNSVSEEELFAALLQERVAKAKGDETGAEFTELVEKHKGEMRGADGFVRFEDAAKAALRELRDAGDLTAEEADKLYSEAFSAAQLDGNKSTLYDDRGGAGDPTVATQVLEQALLATRVILEKFDGGDEEAEMRSVDEASNSKPVTAPAESGGDHSAPQTSGAGASPVADGPSKKVPDLALALSEPSGTVFDGPNGFLFKPISENQGTLAVLMPEILAHQVESVVLKDASGNVLDEGTSTGYGDLGTREKFSFSRRGGDYPQDIVVEARLADGSVARYAIPDPSQRYD